MFGRGFRVAAMAAVIVTASFVIHAEVTPQSQSAEIQLQLGHEFLAEGRYLESLRRHPGGAARRGVRPRPNRSRHAGGGVAAVA